VEEVDGNPMRLIYRSPFAWAGGGAVINTRGKSIRSVAEPVGHPSSLGALAGKT
jgi:hypothetical protein